MAPPGKKFARLVATGTPGTSTDGGAELSGTMRADATVAYVDGSAARGVRRREGQRDQRRAPRAGAEHGRRQLGALQIEVPANFEWVLTTGTNPDTGNPVCVPGDALAANAICDIVLRFRPNTALGNLTGTLRVSATGFGAASGNQDKQLSGVGLPVGGIYLAPTPSDFGSAAAGRGRAHRADPHRQQPDRRAGGGGARWR